MHVLLMSDPATSVRVQEDSGAPACSENDEVVRKDDEVVIIRTSSDGSGGGGNISKLELREARWMAESELERAGLTVGTRNVLGLASAKPSPVRLSALPKRKRQSEVLSSILARWI